MPRTLRFTSPFLLILFFFGPSAAQTTPTQQTASPEVAVTASGGNLRYATLGEVHQTRLQVISPGGALAFDSDFRLGNLIDWQLRDQQGQPLGPGSYLFLITVKDFSGRLTQKYGSALLEEGQVYLEQTHLDSLPQAQATALRDNMQAETLSAVDRIGAAGINSASGAAPSGGAEPSGTAGARGTTPGGESATGEGTQHFLAKWLDNAGGLGNSVIYEDAAGRIGIGTNAPREGVTAFTSAGVAKYIMSEWGAGGTVALGGDNSAGPFLISHTDSLGRATGNYTASRVRFGAQGVGFDISPPTPVGQVRSWTTQAILDPSGRLALSLGSANPTSTLDMAGELNMRGVPAPAVAPAGQGRIFFNSATNTFQVSQNNGAYVNLVGGGGGGGLTLPFTATQSSASTLFSVTNTGDGGAGSFVVSNAVGSANALTVSSNNNSPALKVTNTAGGSAADFRKDNAGNGLPVLFMQNLSVGKGLEIQHNGASGQGASIVLGNSNNPSNALEVSTSGTGGGAVITAGGTATSLTVKGGLRSLVLQGGRFVMQYQNLSSGGTLPNTALVVNILSDNVAASPATTTLPDPNNVEAGTIIYVSTFDPDGVTVTYATGPGTTTTASVSPSEVRYFMRVGTSEACCPARWKPEH